MQYKIKTPHGEGQNEFDTIIEISGLTSSVSINSLLDHLENTAKTMKQQIGQVMANEMLMKSAVEELPILKEIPEDKVALAISYLGKKQANEMSQDLIQTCKETIETYFNHLKKIEEETGIKCLPAVSPIQEAVNNDETKA